MGDVTPTREDADAAAARSYARYREAVARTDALIEHSATPEGKSPEEIRARAIERLSRVRRFLEQLGNPHDQYPIIHVGGTSGKGSTSTVIAAILAASGYRTGLHTSPYLQAATEKLQINGRLIAAEDFASLVDATLDGHRQWLRSGGDSLTYGEIWMALVAFAFARQRVDVAVIEVGAGGRFDLTNVVRPTISVITSVGLDHTLTLGDTIPEIAWHKAGIIKPDVPAITGVLEADALAPIVAEAARQRAELIRVIAGETYETLPSDGAGARWRELPTDGKPAHVWTSPLAGRYQAANGALAVATVRALTRQGFHVTDDAIGHGLAAARLPGRWERVQGSPAVILDGAHNPQKVAALVTDLPGLVDQPLIIVLGALETKAPEALLSLLAPHADELVLTLPRVLAKPGANPATLVAAAQAVGFRKPLLVEPDPVRAIARALERAKAIGGTVLVTGSLYLVGNVREHWYAERDIVVQQTSWPRPT